MSIFLAELGKNLAARWLTLLVPSGLLFFAVAGAGLVLGQQHWYELALITRKLDELAAHPATRSTGVVALAATGTLMISAGLALAIQALSGTVEKAWIGDWPRPLRPLARHLTERRHRQWQDAEQAFQDAVRDAFREPQPASAATEARLARLNAVRNRISLVEPERPGWIADRIRAADLRIQDAYRLDLDSAWSRLWLIIPDGARAELRTARNAYDAALRLTAWSVPYLILAVWWWPSAVIALGTMVVGHRRGRSTMDAFAELVESAVDLYGRELASALGLSCPGALDRITGRDITTILRKGS